MESIADVAPITTPSPSTNTQLRWTLDSIMKLTTCLFLAAICCYAAVSPRTLPWIEYNQLFYSNLRIASLAMIPPLLILILVMDVTNNTIQNIVNCFYHAFTVGYVSVFVMEVIITTLLRLLVFALSERPIFGLSPKVPLWVVPWVLREYHYRPKRITLFVADFVTSCVACPLLEEWGKLLLLQGTVSLPRYVQPPIEGV